MSKAKTNNMIIKRIVDAAMTLLLLLLMAYQVTGERAHEWIGMGMAVLVIVHQILNRKWYGTLFKGKYNPYRSITTVLNILLMASFALTAFCGMSMSGYAVPFLYGMAPVSFVRRMHLSMSHWAFVLMGLHLGDSRAETERQDENDPGRYLYLHRRRRTLAVPAKQHAELSVLSNPICLS